MRYTAPAKERGTAYLRSGESTWLFLPSAEKVVRVGAKQNFGGGDFSNADIFRLSLVRDYDPTLAGEETVEGEACYKLELKAKDRSVAYDRVVYWVRSDGTFYPVKADYYTLSGKNLKSLVLSQVKPIGGRPRPTLMTMESRVDEGSRTRLEFLTIQDDPKLDDRLFSPGALERGRVGVVIPRDFGGTGPEESAGARRPRRRRSPRGPAVEGPRDDSPPRLPPRGRSPRPASSSSASRASPTAAPRRPSTGTTSSASTTYPGLGRLAVGWRETHGSFRAVFRGYVERDVGHAGRRDRLGRPAGLRRSTGGARRWACASASSASPGARASPGTRRTASSRRRTRSTPRSSRKGPSPRGSTGRPRRGRASSSSAPRPTRRPATCRWPRRRSSAATPSPSARASW